MDAAERYFESNEHGQFLWNAKPRFGKTLASYDLCKTLDAKKVLIVTNRPAIADSWYSDYEKFLGPSSGYTFVSTINGIRGCRYVRDTADFPNPDSKIINFVSLQDLKGSLHFGGNYDKLRYIKDTAWDLLIIDEAHEGVDTFKTDVAFDRIDRRWTLHLSGTPFKAIASDKFGKDAVFNWTYADEQEAKREWEENSESCNPYGNLPELAMFTYRMSDMIADKVGAGIPIDGENMDYAFDLNEFFATDGKGSFIHDSDVDRFLDALTTQDRYPYSTDELRDKMAHTLWLMDRVDGAKRLASKLRNHPVFGQYTIVEAVGDFNDDGSGAKSALEKVRKAIRNSNRTITLTVGQLTTGVTVPEWTGVLMLSNVKSASLYMQTAFRAQTPWEFQTKDGVCRKENAYVFDFDPARTLDIYEQFANDLYSDTSAGRGDSGKRKENARKLLNFFPVIGEDEDGAMIELDAEKVLSIPRALRSKQVVRRGFICDFLFQNVTNVFHASPKVWDIIGMMPAVSRDEALNLDRTEAMSVDLDENGEVVVDKAGVIGLSKELFGDKIYETDADDLSRILEEKADGPKSAEDVRLEKIMDFFHRDVTVPMIDIASEKFEKDLNRRAKNHLEKHIDLQAENRFHKALKEHSINERTLNSEMEKEIDSARGDSAKEEVRRRYDELIKKNNRNFVDVANEIWNSAVEDAGNCIVEKVETDRKEKTKKEVSEGIRNHLRGFSRTIPSFLMAYGSEADITLANIDTIVPPDVFKEVASISVEDFRLLRDGGEMIGDDGMSEHFDGHLFDETVFDDSVKEFMALRIRLADYFANNAEDIFDYIPPQRNNQIFTPKHVVKQMVDMLEKENPGCFDDDSATFADLYMKSGLYVAEIVRRLYNSPGIARKHPDREERLRHIFAHQVFGLAPSEIIHRIVLSYVLGFAENGMRMEHNLRRGDLLAMGSGDELRKNLIKIFPDLQR